ncbi:MAG TPA: ABC transporter permease [Verrucomicrobiae bacterium]|nr:ABC transporter permease [Verrucomicrobiae bacterium]
MRIFLTLLRRELGAFFLSPTGCLIIAAVTLILGLTYDVLMTNLLGDKPQEMPITELFYASYIFWLIVLLIAPVITMRLFAHEKYSGTFETLMTTPVNDLQVVASKFAASIIFYMITWLPMLACLYVVRHFTNQHESLDAGMIGGTYLGIFLVGCLFLALGCFASSLTRSQMAAAMVSFVLGIALFLLSFLGGAITSPENWTSEVLSYFNLFDQMHNFSRGMVDTKAVIFYVSLTFFFLFLTLRAVESRRWK